MNPQGAKHRRILREGIRSTHEYHRVLLSASDADPGKLHLLLSALEVDPLRPISVTTASHDAPNASSVSPIEKGTNLKWVSLKELENYPMGRIDRQIANMIITEYRTPEA